MFTKAYWSLLAWHILNSSLRRKRKYYKHEYPDLFLSTACAKCFLFEGFYFHVFLCQRLRGSTVVWNAKIIVIHASKTLKKMFPDYRKPQGTHVKQSQYLPLWWCKHLRASIKGPCSEEKRKLKRAHHVVAASPAPLRYTSTGRKEGEKKGFPCSPNMVKQRWGVQQMSHHSDSYTPIPRMCARQRGRANWARQQENNEIKALQWRKKKNSGTNLKSKKLCSHFDIYQFHWGYSSSSNDCAL